jgi:hypothetical protein
MQNAEKVVVLDNKHSQQENVKENNTTILEKIKHLEIEHSDSNFTLLKRFLKEIQFANDTLLSNYNREVI